MTAASVVSPIGGVRVPGFIYGTAWKKERTAELVELALNQGFRGIDTAGQPKHYDEAGVGAGVAACLAKGLSRADIYLQTKFTPPDGQDPRRMPYDPKAGLADQVSQSFRSSLSNLRTDYVDCLILHSPLATAAQLMEVWTAMESIVTGGGARQIGISNCYAPEELACLYDQAAIKPAVVQNRFYAATGYDREIRRFCRDRGIIYQSFWTLTANDWLLGHGVVLSLAAKYRQTPAQIWFRYVSQNGIVPLTGTTSAQHMREDLAIFEFELLAEELSALDALLAP